MRLNSWTNGAVVLTLVSSAIAQSTPPRVLCFSRTLEFRHDSIPAAQDALRSMSSSFLTDFTEDPTAFTSDNLAGYAAVVFLSNSEGLADSDPEVLDTNEQKQALFDWLGRGGALVGLHAGCACLFKTPAFGVAMGSWFDYHPDISNVTFLKVGTHPTIDMLPDRYTTYEEAYNFLTPPTGVNATVLLTPDGTSYSDPEYVTRGSYQGSIHPSAWYREEAVSLANGSTTAAIGGTMTGRLWYTSLGHTIETWQTDVHRQHVQAGIEWALGGSSNTFVNTTSSSSSISPSGSTSASTTQIRSTFTPEPTTTSPGSGSTPPPTSLGYKLPSNSLLAVCVVVFTTWLAF